MESTKEKQLTQGDSFGSLPSAKSDGARLAYAKEYSSNSESTAAATTTDITDESFGVDSDGLPSQGHQPSKSPLDSESLETVESISSDVITGVVGGKQSGKHPLISLTGPGSPLSFEKAMPHSVAMPSNASHLIQHSMPSPRRNLLHHVFSPTAATAAVSSFCTNVPSSPSRTGPDTVQTQADNSYTPSPPQSGSTSLAASTCSSSTVSPACAAVRSAPTASSGLRAPSVDSQEQESGQGDKLAQTPSTLRPRRIQDHLSSSSSTNRHPEISPNLSGLPLHLSNSSATASTAGASPTELEDAGEELRQVVGLFMAAGNPTSQKKGLNMMSNPNTFLNLDSSSITSNNDKLPPLGGRGSSISASAPATPMAWYSRPLRPGQLQGTNSGLDRLDGLDRHRGTLHTSTAGAYTPSIAEIRRWRSSESAVGSGAAADAVGSDVGAGGALQQQLRYRRPRQGTRVSEALLCMQLNQWPPVSLVDRQLQRSREYSPSTLLHAKQKQQLQHQLQPENFAAAAASLCARIPEEGTSASEAVKV